jgi:hypothetical protein
MRKTCITSFALDDEDDFEETAHSGSKMKIFGKNSIIWISKYSNKDCKNILYNTQGVKTRRCIAKYY